MKSNKKYFFLAFGLIAIIAANLICYQANGRLLRLPTNLILLGLTTFVYIKNQK